MVGGMKEALCIVNETQTLDLVLLLSYYVWGKSFKHSDPQFLNCKARIVYYLTDYCEY